MIDEGDRRVTRMSVYCEPFMASLNEPESCRTYLATEAFTKVCACSTSYHYSRSDNVVPVLVLGWGFVLCMQPCTGSLTKAFLLAPWIVLHFAKNHLFFLNAVTSVPPVPIMDCMVIWALELSTYYDAPICMLYMCLYRGCGSAHTGMLHAFLASIFAISEVPCNRIDMQILCTVGITSPLTVLFCWFWAIWLVSHMN